MADRKLEFLVTARDRAGAVLQGVGTGLRAVGIAAAAATAALAVVGGALTAAALAAAKQQDADVKLANALKSIGQNTKEARDELKEFNAEMQRATAVGDDELQEIEAILISLGKLEGED